MINIFVPHSAFSHRSQTLKIFQHYTVLTKSDENIKFLLIFRHMKKLEDLKPNKLSLKAIRKLRKDQCDYRRGSVQD